MALAALHYAVVVHAFSMLVHNRKWNEERRDQYQEKR